MPVLGTSPRGTRAVIVVALVAVKADDGRDIVASVGEVTTMFTAETLEKFVPTIVRVVGVVLPAVVGLQEVIVGTETALVN